MLVHSDVRSESDDLLGCEVVRRAGIGATAYGGSIIVGALRWECWVLFNVDVGPSRQCNGYKRQGAQ